MIIEAIDKAGFRGLIGKIDKNLYDMYITANGDLLLRPNVTTRGRDTFLLKNQSIDVCDEIAKWYGGCYRIKTYSFKEDILI